MPAPEGARRTAALPAGHSPALEDCSSLDGEVCGSMTGIMYTFGLDSLFQELRPQSQKYRQTLEFEQRGLRDLLPATCLVQRQTPLPLICGRKDDHDLPPVACKQLQLVTPCREQDVALDHR